MNCQVYAGLMNTCISTFLAAGRDYSYAMLRCLKQVLSRMLAATGHQKGEYYADGLWNVKAVIKRLTHMDCPQDFFMVQLRPYPLRQVPFQNTF